MIFNDESSRIYEFQALLHAHAHITSLKINFTKISIIHLKMRLLWFNVMFTSFLCKGENFPLKYLGLILLSTKLTKQVRDPIKSA